MTDPIDEFVHRWRQNPNPASTVALCDALRERPRGSLVNDIGSDAVQRHPRDVDVLLSVARMYMETDLLGQAQTVLVSAGKESPRDARVYRWLGEVLLRRGDAQRAEKVFERAIQLGASEPEVQLWLDRARVYRPMQVSAGEVAVAAEVVQTRSRAPGAMSPETMAYASPGPLKAPAPAPLRIPPLAAPPPPARAPRVVAPAPAPRAPLSPVRPPPQVERTVPSAPPPAVARAPQRRESVAAPPAQPLSSRLFGTPSPPQAHAPQSLRPAVPYPRDVLDALALSGLFELQAPVARGPSWDRPDAGPKRKGRAALITGTVLFLAAIVGTYGFYRQKRAADHLRAEAILDGVELALHAGKPDTLADVESQLATAFQLESRNPRAALDWTRERAMVGLVKSGQDIAFEDAMNRAKEMGIPDEKVAFALVASFLFQGDTAGAAGVLPRWDGPASEDPWYQLVTGAALERAGDSRARDRYAAAAKLDPDLFVAQIGLARILALSGDSEQATRLARDLRARFPDRVEPVALVALAWGRDPARQATTPPEVDEVQRRDAELPYGLHFVPHAIAALVAMDRRAADDARAEVVKGLAAAEGPGPAVWLGTLALPLGDESLARQAALSALQFSAVYEPARALAARVALHSGRLDEALKATEDLDSASADVVVVRGAAAYERLDPDGLALALQALTPDDRKLPFVSGLFSALDALGGKLQGDTSHGAQENDVPWADLVAMDKALDAGNLVAADPIAAAWGKESEGKPLRALRLARLARYEGHLDAADTLSQLALDHGTVTPRVLRERVFELVAREKASDVPPLLAKYPLVLGPLATWLNAFATASAGGVDAARAKVASLDPPPTGAPFEARTIAAATLGALKDRKRGADYTRDLLSTGSLDPDLVAAALALGFHRVDHGRRRPTYE